MLGGGILLALGLGGGSLPQPLLLGLLGLRPVLVQQLEQLSGCLLVEGGLELLDWRGHLQTGAQHGLLSLETDVLGPFDESGEVPLGLDILADSVVPGPLLKQGVHDPLGGALGDGKGRCRHLFASLLSLNCQDSHGLELDDLALPLLVTSQLKVLARLDGQHALGSAVGVHTLQPQHNLLGGLCLLPEDGLGLSTISTLLPVVSPLTLCIEGVLALLVLGHFVWGVLLALLAIRPPSFRDVHHGCNRTWSGKR